jgi:hypothetical protein
VRSGTFKRRIDIKNSGIRGGAQVREAFFQPLGR